MFWDVLVAVAIGNRRVRHRFAQALPWLERVSGGILILLAAMVVFSTINKIVASA